MDTQPYQYLIQQRQQVKQLLQGKKGAIAEIAVYSVDSITGVIAANSSETPARDT